MSANAGTEMREQEKVKQLMRCADVIMMITDEISWSSYTQASLPCSMKEGILEPTTV